jgi:hypothetical protein
MFLRNRAQPVSEAANLTANCEPSVAQTYRPHRPDTGLASLTILIQFVSMVVRIGYGTEHDHNPAVPYLRQLVAGSPQRRPRF